MFPVPLAIGPFNFTFYGLMVAGGIAAALALLSLTAPYRRISPALARDFCFWMVLAGLIGSRLAYVIFHRAEFSGLLDILAYWRGGLMFQGGVIGALAVTPLFLKRYQLKFWDTADILAPSLALGQAFGRLGCLGAGCCYGRPAGEGNPLAIVFPDYSFAPACLPLLPTQPAEAAGLFILAAILFTALRGSREERPQPGPDSGQTSLNKQEPRPAHHNGMANYDRPGKLRDFALTAFKTPGRVAGLYLMGAGFLRLIMDLFLRGDFRGANILPGFPPTALTALGSASLGLIIWMWKRPKGR